MLDTMVRYIALIAIPATLGMAVLSAPLITALYGSKYLPAIPVLFIVALFGSARALMAPLEQYLQAADRQDLLVRAMVLTSIVNVVLAVLLIPAGGAIGAALSNGLSQTLGALACWLLTLRVFPLKISWPRVGRILVASLGMAAAVWPLTTALPSWASLAVGAPLGAAVYLLLLRWTGSLDREDSNRLSAIGSKLPSRFVPLYQRLLMSLIPVGAR
jgi:O-antigen/teichoic acid export membrane protein